MGLWDLSYRFTLPFLVAFSAEAFRRFWGSVPAVSFRRQVSGEFPPDTWAELTRDIAKCRAHVSTAVRGAPKGSH
jgi:hypothetical protein